MEITQKIGVHNKFEIEVFDTKTQTVRQKAVAYNVVLDKYFLCVRTYNSSSSWTFPTAVGIGTGTSTPATTDTTLTNAVTVQPTDVEAVYTYPTSHRTVQAVFGTSVGAGTTFTEVGLYGYAGLITYLVTRALLQDSEGNPISIAKTNTDVLTVTATFYCTYTSGGIGSNGIYPVAASNNILVKWLLGNATPSFRAKFVPSALTDSADLDRMYVNSVSCTRSYSSDSKTLTMSYEVPQASYNSQSIRTLGIPGIGAVVFPDSSLLDYYRITSETVGTGDGVTTEFNTACPNAKSGTAHVFIDGTEVTTGFTFDYNSNCTDRWGNYASAGMTLEDTTHVHYGNYADLASGNYTRYEPFVFGNSCSTATQKVSSTVSVSQANPCWLDFTTATRCNTFKTTLSTSYFPAAQYDNLVIEYSADNETWTAVTYTRTDLVYKFPAVTARYWRFYVSGYTMSIVRQPTATTKDGQSSITNFFALGYTGAAITFTTPPAVGEVVSVTYDIDVPYKTANNLIRGTFVIQLGSD